jgi:AraC-like DNA-binding protein
MSRTHSINALLPTLTRMAELGISADICLRGSGITPAHLRDQRHEVSLAQETRLYRNILEHSADPTIGLQIGAVYRPQRYGLFGYALMAAPTLRHALVLIARFGDLAYSWFDIRYSITEHVSLSYNNRSAIDNDVANLLRDRDCAAALTGMSDLLGYRPDLLSVHLPHDGHGQRPRYQTHFACPVHFNSAPTRLDMSLALLDQPLPHHDAAALDMLHQQCQLLLSKMSRQTDFVDDVRQLLLSRPGYFPDIAYVAEKLGLPERTLRRRLHDANTRYSAILDDVRLGLAREYLRNSTLPLQDIAPLLGYTEPGNFTHAFKRWTGVSPTAYRQNLDH